jgi:hypothetical protein
MEAPVDIGGLLDYILVDPDAVDWWPCKEPVGFPELVPASPRLVYSTKLPWVPGVRLTKNLLGVMDSLGFETYFFAYDRVRLCARTRGLDGRVTWMVAVRRGSPHNSTAPAPAG